MTSPNGSGPAAMTPEEKAYRARLALGHEYFVDQLAREDARLRLARMRRGQRKPLAEMATDAGGLAALPDPEPLVRCWLQLDSLAWVSGPPESGKSFVALDIACCVATGTAWHGFAVTQVPALYVVAESPSGFKRRVPAWRESAPFRPELDRLTFLPYPVQIPDPADMAELTELCLELGSKLVIFDTQSRCAVGAEENQSSEMSVLVDSLDRLRADTGACVLTVHHTPRTAVNLRGSNAQEGAATTIIAVTKDGPVVTLSAETARGGKQKDIAALPPLQLGMKPFAGSVALVLDDGTLKATTREVLRAMGSQQWSLSALVTASGLGKSTVFRALRELDERGLAAVSSPGTRTAVWEATAAGLSTVGSSAPGTNIGSGTV